MGRTVSCVAVVLFSVFLSLCFASSEHIQAQASIHALSSATRTEIIDEITALIEHEYFDPVIAERVSATLRRQARDDVYRDAATLDQLAAQMSAELFRQTGDRHLAVTIPRRSSSTRAAPPRAELVRSSNSGIQRVEILVGNVGYLNVTAFWRLEEARETLSDAMRLLRRADALIIDMRDNGGGSPDTVGLLAGYMFDSEALALFDIVSRTGERETYKTPSPGVPDRSETRPIWVLTSGRTFSAAEGFAFLLQERRRAEVVGERTPGAANPGRPHTLLGLQVTIPNGVVRSAHSGGNWEGVGVLPDIPVSGSSALEVAHSRALQRLQRTGVQ